MGSAAAFNPAAERAALEGIDVEIVGYIRREYDAWAQRAALLEDPCDEVATIALTSCGSGIPG